MEPDYTRILAERVPDLVVLSALVGVFLRHMRLTSRQTAEAMNAMARALVSLRVHLARQNRGAPLPDSDQSHLPSPYGQ